MQEKILDPQVKNRLDYLYLTAHKLYSTNPQLASHLLLNFNEYAQENNVSIPLDISSTFCNVCGSIFVGGVNARISIITESVGENNIKPMPIHDSRNNSNNGQDFKNNLNDDIKKQSFVVYDCLICQNKTRVMVHLKSPSNSPKQQKIKPTKKKKASLASLLNNKKQSTTNSYSLADFLDQN